MLAAIREMAEKKDECTKQTHVCTAEYLEACNLIFENGILSHEMICSPNSKALVNISEGMKWFLKWKEELQKQPGKKSHPLRCPRPFFSGGLGQAPYLCTNITCCNYSTCSEYNYSNFQFIVYQIYTLLCYTDVKFKSPLQKVFLAWQVRVVQAPMFSFHLMLICPCRLGISCSSCITGSWVYVRIS